MNNEQILRKARKVLANNKGYKNAVKFCDELGIDSEPIEELIFLGSNDVVLSNEGSIPLTHEVFTTELLWGLDEAFKKANLFVEPYDSGTFHIYHEVQ